jgi:hypothetical protein
MDSVFFLDDASGASVAMVFSRIAAERFAASHPEPCRIRAGFIPDRVPVYGPLEPLRLPGEPAAIAEAYSWRPSTGATLPTIKRSL